MKQKAAMFGLDARIALTIFGALSVITGASLFSTIKHIKKVSYINQLEEIQKATIQYYVDTGSYPTESNHWTLNASHLINAPAGVIGWRGPYLNGITSGSYLNLSTAFDNIYLRLGSIDNAWDSPLMEPGGSCSSSCFIWIAVTGSSTSPSLLDEDFRNAIDKHYDGQITPTTGKVRTSFNEITNKASLYITVMPYKG